ncbi:hypothetical protein GTU71_13190 [Rathayibacter sp. VKM Ac-2762]|uniref:hypothetical protein n=1 Tax=Rathayibacter sp. VKM Ac-2762 TaxID=2609254 RepID=UPI00132EAC14|nr:hypothetical protein [Rathayibacter sp. VKM Ac-2762]QHF21695.1 hypothetical protein GTU71_13190 [Rathayibacter sp. VKM Ac-2762]
MDRYQRTTQLVPAAAAVAPLSFAAIVTFQWEDLPPSIVTCLAAAGFHLVIMRLIRDRGNKVQDRLWQQWGGHPTALRLRWSSATDQSAHADLHRRVQAMTGTKLPKAAVERSDSAQADATYERAVARLREMTRDRTRYHRVFSELLEYSTARNLLGVKPWGLTISVSVLLLASGAAVVNVLGRADFSWLPVILSGAAALAISALWIVIITPAYVKRPATRYAEALLNAAAEPTD